jgi:hypothetical protein
LPGVTIVTVTAPADAFFTTSVEPTCTVSDAAGAANVGGEPANTGTEELAIAIQVPSYAATAMKG